MCKTEINFSGSHIHTSTATIVYIAKLLTFKEIRKFLLAKLLKAMNRLPLEFKSKSNREMTVSINIRGKKTKKNDE